MRLSYLTLLLIGPRRRHRARNPDSCNYILFLDIFKFYQCNCSHDNCALCRLVIDGKIAQGASSHSATLSFIYLNIFSSFPAFLTLYRLPQSILNSTSQSAAVIWRRAGSGSQLLKTTSKSSHGKISPLGSDPCIDNYASFPYTVIVK